MGYDRARMQAMQVRSWLVEQALADAERKGTIRNDWIDLANPQAGDSGHGRCRVPSPDTLVDRVHVAQAFQQGAARYYEVDRSGI